MLMFYCRELLKQIDIIKQEILSMKRTSSYREKSHKKSLIEQLNEKESLLSILGIRKSLISKRQDNQFNKGNISNQTKRYYQRMKRKPSIWSG